MCVYHITVYAALTLFRDTHTWAKGAAGEKSRANLGSAIQTLNAAPILAMEIRYGHPVIKEMRDELKIPRPAAMVSDQAVATVPEATIFAHPVSTSLEVPVSAAPVSTSSEAPVSDQSVSAGSAPTVPVPPVSIDVEDSVDPGLTPSIDEKPSNEQKKSGKRAKAKQKAAAKPKQQKRSRAVMQAEEEEKPATPTRRSNSVSVAFEKEVDDALRDGWGNGEVEDTMRDADMIFQDEEEDNKEASDVEDGHADLDA